MAKVFVYPFAREIAASTIFGNIHVNEQFTRLPERVRAALIYHELGHLQGAHHWKRLAAMWSALFNVEKFKELCHNQEYEADHYAARCGYGHDLARFLGALNQPESCFYPASAARIQRLTGSAADGTVLATTNPG